MGAGGEVLATADVVVKAPDAAGVKAGSVLAKVGVAPVKADAAHDKAARVKVDAARDKAAPVKVDAGHGKAARVRAACRPARSHCAPLEQSVGHP